MDYILELERIKYHIRKNEKDEGKYQKLKHMFLDLQNEIDELYPCTDDEGDEIHFLDAEYSGRAEVMTNATPHRFDDANPDTWCRCHNLNRTEIRTEIIVNSHDALVAALGLSYEALSGMGEQTEAASAAAYDALEAAHDQLPCVCGDDFGICDCAVAKVTAALSEAAK